VIDICADGADGSGSEAGTAADEPPTTPFVTSDPSLLLPLFRAHGTGSLSYASLVNQEFEHLYCPDSGSIAFVAAPPQKRFGSVRAAMAVGDPLAPRGAWAAIGRAFLQAFPNGFFGYASADFARTLLELEAASPSRRRLAVNDWGLATRIVAPPASSSSSSLPGCRSAQQDARRALKSGLRVREVALLDLLALGDSNNTRQQLRAISSLWLSKKITRDRELRVFCRSLDFLEDDKALMRDAEAGTRLFVAERDDDADGSIDAFAVLDPQCEGGRVVGWVLASSRSRPQAHKGALKLLVQHLVTSGALLPPLESAEQPPPPPLDLGLAPFAALSHPKNCPFSGGAAWMRLAARFLYSCADGRLYAFRNLALQKAHYGRGKGGEQAPLFCVHRGGRGWVPDLTFVVELYAMMVHVGFVGDGVRDTVLRLWGFGGR
jgi:hypothetical protein